MLFGWSSVPIESYPSVESSLLVPLLFFELTSGGSSDFHPRSKLTFLSVSFMGSGTTLHSELCLFQSGTVVATLLHLLHVIGVSFSILAALSLRTLNITESANPLSKWSSTDSGSTKKGDVNDMICFFFVIQTESKSDDIICRWSGSNEGTAWYPSFMVIDASQDDKFEAMFLPNVWSSFSSCKCDGSKSFKVFTWHMSPIWCAFSRRINSRWYFAFGYCRYTQVMSF